MADSTKAVFTIFEDAPGFWFVPVDKEESAIAKPEQHRGEVYKTKIAACRAALKIAVAQGAKELHLHGFGATTGIKREASAKGVKPFIYWPTVTTKLASFVGTKKS